MLPKICSPSVLAAVLLLVLPALSMAQVSVNISVDVPPPELPVYDQPPIPGDGYLWTPGYWAWGDDIQDYYWVPGTWVLAPQPNYLWTPGYWAAVGAVFYWHRGYWGPHVGFYGGVNYGYGYGGEGFEGGYWREGRLYYNRSVNNINNTNITNVYNKTVINNITVNRVSYNGGSGGVRAQPSAADAAAAHDRHINYTPEQHRHEQTARTNPAMRAAENRGRPAIAATPRPGAFSASGVEPATRGSPMRGTMSVVRPQQVSPRPENRNDQPQYRGGQPENRNAQPQYRSSQPENRAAPPTYRSAQPQYRAPQAEPRQEAQRQPEQPQERQQHAPAPPQERQQPEPRPRPEPYPPEHSAEHHPEHDHH